MKIRRSMPSFSARHLTLKSILWFLAVPVLGFVMLNLAFLGAALFHGAIDLVISPFITPDNMRWRWFPPLKHFLYLCLLGGITWPIMRSKLHILPKAVWLCVPLAAAAVTVGVLLYPHQMATAVVGALAGLGVIYWLWRAKSPWLYWWSFVFIAILMIIVAVFNVEI